MKKNAWIGVLGAIVLVIVAVTITVGCFFATCWLGEFINDRFGMGGVVFGAATLLASLLKPITLDD